MCPCTFSSPHRRSSTSCEKRSSKYFAAQLAESGRARALQHRLIAGYRAAWKQSSQDHLQCALQHQCKVRYLTFGTLFC